MEGALQIAVAGGGIVGLTAALSLHAAGFRPVVYEAVSEPAPLGVGVNLLPHAVRELTELGLLDELLDLGVAPGRCGGTRVIRPAPTRRQS